MSAESWFLSVASACKKVIKEDGTISVEELARTANVMSPVYSKLFSLSLVVKALTDDLNGNAAKATNAMKENPAARATVEGLLADEVKAKGVEGVRKNKNSGTIGLLWLKRALEFVFMFMDLTFVSWPGKTSKECAQHTYKTVLSPYHGFLTSNVVGMAMGAVPSRDDLVIRMGYKDLASAQAAAKDMLIVLKPIIDKLNKAIEENKCNFTDKA